MKLFAILALALALPLPAAAQALPAPVVVVYPLASGNGAVDQTGENLATAISTKLIALGGLDVKPFLPGTTRPDYLTAALKLGADYYVTGFLTPLGAEVSLVEQVVSTHSGSIVYSTTALAHTYADAIAPADLLRGAILHHAGRGLAQLDAPAPSPTPQTVGQNGGVNLTQALRHHRKTAPSPASPVPAGSPVSVARPGGPGSVANVQSASRLALVLPTGGTAEGASRSRATTALSNALRARGIANAVLSVTANDVTAHARELCRANAGSQGFYAGTLGIAAATGVVPQTVTVDVTRYDCDAHVVGQQHVVATVRKRPGLERTIDDAVGRATDALAAATEAAPPAKS